MGEQLLPFLYRRMRQWLRTPKRDPIHGTPSHATSEYITNYLGYEHIYPNDDDRWHCICDEESAYVLDVQMPLDHTMTIYGRVAYTTAKFDPYDIEVGNVHRLSPKRTHEMKARRQHDEAQRKYILEWLEGDGLHLPDWESLPKW